MPADGRWPAGNPDRSADEAYGARPDCLCRGRLVALHGFIKKTRTAPDEDMAIARKRQKELER
jgi:hypothetical protein